MKKKIIILGSTGSVGKNVIDIIKNEKNKFDVKLLIANNNYRLLFNQANEVKSKYIYISNPKYKDRLKKLCKNSNIELIYNFDEIEKKIRSRSDILVSAISGLDGLKYNLSLIKKTYKILFANKESIICAWNLINKEIQKYKVKFLPLDSEHFAINELIKNDTKKNLNRIIITASGGPFLNFKLNQFRNITVKNALNHPKWKMGKKISIDSATLMNKVFEVIEAYRLFGLDKNMIEVIIHPNSMVHALVVYKTGFSKALIHYPSMKIPIYNSIFDKPNKKYLTKHNSYFKNMSDLKFLKVDKKKFPSIMLINKLPDKCTLFFTVLVSANDTLVNLFLQKKIKFLDIIKNLNKVLNLDEFKKYRNKIPSNYTQINVLDKHVRLKTTLLSIK